jgi:hypothetical protein
VTTQLQVLLLLLLLLLLVVVVVVIQQVLSASLNGAQHKIKFFITNFGSTTQLHQINFIPVYGILKVLNFLQQQSEIMGSPKQ